MFFCITTCKSCDKEIVFLSTSKGNSIPVDWDSLSFDDQKRFIKWIPVLFNPHRGHISHFATCPDADNFRRKKTKPEQKYTQLELFE